MFKRPEQKGMAIPSSTYEAVLKQVREKDKKWQDEEPKPGLEFVYQVLVPGVGLVEVGRHVTNTIGSKSLLTKDLKALVGEEGYKAALQSDESWNTTLSDIVGKSCLLVCEKRQSSNGNEYTDVKGVIPLPPGYVPKAHEAAASTAALPGTPGGGTIFVYDIKAIDKSHKAQAIEMLKTAGCTEGAEGQWSCPCELPKLIKFKVNFNDDIPF